jgi:hypothetical protein
MNLGVDQNGSMALDEKLRTGFCYPSEGLLITGPFLLFMSFGSCAVRLSD